MDFIKYFISNRPDLIELMEKTSHHYSIAKLNPFHIEGSILLHSMMVAKSGRSTLALCHDIGKCFTREVNEDDQKVSFIGHSGVSMYMSVNLLKGFLEKEPYCDTNNTLLESYLFCISHHTKIFELIREPDLNKLINYYRGVPLSTIKMLFELARADNYGRVSMDESDKDRLEITKPVVDELSKEYKPKHKNHKLHLLVGPPGVGKSTYISNNLNDCVVVSRDDLIEKLPGNNYREKFIYSTSISQTLDNQLDLAFREAIKANQDIAIDMTNMSPKSRRRWISQVPKGRYEVVCHNIIKDFDTIMAQNNRRFRETNKDISESLVLSMMGRYTAPVYSEGIDTIYNIF